jgi:isopentenyl-diphosphate delta-isomerase
MPESSENISKRKKEHIELCLTDNVSFKGKTTGFEHYDFVHYAPTEVEIDKIDFTQKFFKRIIKYPFLISCMTGGTIEAESINAKLAIAANELGIPIGIGSQRQMFEDKKNVQSFKIIRINAPDVPVLGNIGAAQVVRYKSIDPINYMIEVIDADVMVVHLNPLQELLQKNGEPNFAGLLSCIEKIANEIEVPLFVKEVGAGISASASKSLLDAGVKGIDIAGAGGTSWAGVEILRNKEDERDYFWDWGLPSSYCIRTNAELKNDYDFVLIGSGGINSAVDAAKAFALGADIIASARTILQQLNKKNIEGVIELIENWFAFIKKIMFLTGSKNLSELKNNKLKLKEEFY